MERGQVYYVNFYPRSPCGERQYHQILLRRSASYFYPRSPCGERLIDEIQLEFNSLISIHALLAESDSPDTSSTQCKLISIHALLAESDIRVLLFFAVGLYFYPRSPCGERRSTSLTFPGFGMISIHALLAESDIEPIFGKINARDFYPRSPCGERHDSTRRTYQQGEFLSTLSLRRATCVCWTALNHP